MSKEYEDFGAFLTGFVIGGLVGAAVALLVAPQSGEDTRTLIMDKSIELKDKVGESAEELKQKAHEYQWKSTKSEPAVIEETVVAEVTPNNDLSEFSE